MGTVFRDYPTVPVNVEPDVPHWVNLALKEVDRDVQEVADTITGRFLDAVDSANKYTDSARFNRGSIPAETDLNDWLKPGQVSVPNVTLSKTLKNVPAGFNNPWDLYVDEVSVANGIYRQTARIKDTGLGTWQERVRWSLAKVFYDWVDPTAAGREYADKTRWNLGMMPLNTDLDTWLIPGQVSIPLSTTATTIKNRPNGFVNPWDMVTEEVSAANGIYRQTARMKDVGRGTWRKMERWSLARVFYGWEDVSPKPFIEDNRIAIYGDSQSEASAGAWPVPLAAVLNQTSIHNHARSGDTSTEAMLRAGALTLWFSVDGGSIPASGAVDLTTNQRVQLRDARAVTNGTLAGAAGTLTHVADDKFRFTRGTAGNAIPVAGRIRFVSGLDGAATGARTLLAWFGGNDFNFNRPGQSRNIADNVIGNYRKFVSWAIANGREPVIAGVTNRTSAVAGSDGFAQVQRINRELRRMFPDIFLDVQAYYVERAIYDMGLVPTAAELEGMGRGEIPAQLYKAGDGVHLIPEAHKAIAENWIAPWLAARGHVFTTAPLPPLPDLTPADTRA